MTWASAGQEAFGELGAGTKYLHRRNAHPDSSGAELSKRDRGRRFTCGTTTSDKAYCWGLQSRWRRWVTDAD